MNYNRIHRNLWRNRRRNVDWTGKRRLTVTIRIDIASITTQHDRECITAAKDYSDALKCPFVLKGFCKYLYFGGMVTADDKHDTLYMLSYVKLIVRQLEPSGVTWKLLTRYPQEAEFLGDVDPKQYEADLQQYFTRPLFD